MTCSPRSSTGCRPAPRPCPATGCGAGRGHAAWPAAGYEPRNLDFADGLDWWDLDSGPGPDPGLRARRRRARLRGRRRGPVRGPVLHHPAARRVAALIQAIYADDYRGATVTFSGEIRVDPLTGQAGLRLEILRNWWRAGRAREDHGLTIASPCPWTSYEVTARIPANADHIRFGIALTGPGRIALRNPDLHIAEPAPERRERGRLRRRPGPAGPRR